MNKDDDRTAIRKPSVGTENGKSTPCLIVLRGSAVGQVFKVDRASIAIGRADDAEVYLNDDGVSRQHAQLIRYSSELMVLKDLESTNGTYINGQPIKAKALKDGDRIQIGSFTILKFSVQDEVEDHWQQQLYDAAVRDPLTHVYNRRFFSDDLERALRHALRHQLPLSLVLLDIDHFKTINDTYGHNAGDQVLQELANRLNATIRTDDVLCRTGGEEFAVIARGTTAENAQILAERCRNRVAAAPFRIGELEVDVRISLGVAGIDLESQREPNTLMAAADKLLYQAKQSGRNKVCCQDLAIPA
ncbi:MAG TPA: GGDEF domain-containing protein [Polyangiaceae bacterium]|nr:GGDEF domain-containing protein [Polyangiaceae bacterium]